MDHSTSLFGFALENLPAPTPPEPLPVAEAAASIEPGSMYLDGPGVTGLEATEYRPASEAPHTWFVLRVWTDGTMLLRDKS